MFVSGWFFGCLSWSLFSCYGMPRIVAWWKEYTEKEQKLVVSSRTPLDVKTLQAVAVFMDQTVAGEVSQVIVRRDEKTSNLCIAVCLKNQGPSIEHQFLLSDLQFHETGSNGDLLFIRRKDTTVALAQ